MLKYWIFYRLEAVDSYTGNLCFPSFPYIYFPVFAFILVKHSVVTDSGRIDPISESIERNWLTSVKARCSRKYHAVGVRVIAWLGIRKHELFAVNVCLYTKTSGGVDPTYFRGWRTGDMYQPSSIDIGGYMLSLYISIIHNQLQHLIDSKLSTPIFQTNKEWKARSIQDNQSR